MHNVLILANAVVPNGNPDEYDTFIQAQDINEALKNLGINSDIIFLPEKVSKLNDILAENAEITIFNLVENDESKNLIQTSANLLKHLNIPFTGCSPDSLLITNNKTVSKSIMKSYGILTPSWLDCNQKYNIELKEKYIIKLNDEHASVDIDATSIIKPKTFADLNKELSKKTQTGKKFFAEEFVEGREFNVSIIGGKDNFEILPVGEILFDSEIFINREKIVDYNAKWNSLSPEYQGTPRSFSCNSLEPELMKRLKEITELCWKIFKLNGYARVDFRCDNDNNLYVLEINANPCIAKDSGLAAAAAEAKYSYAKLIEIIIKNPLTWN